MNGKMTGSLIAKPSHVPLKKLMKEIAVPGGTGTLATALKRIFGDKKLLRMSNGVRGAQETTNVTRLEKMTKKKKLIMIIQWNLNLMRILRH